MAWVRLHKVRLNCMHRCYDSSRKINRNRHRQQYRLLMLLRMPMQGMLAGMLGKDMPIEGARGVYRVASELFIEV